MDDIIYYTMRRWDQAQADSYENDLWGAMLELRDQPESGSPVVSRFPGYRRRIVHHHHISYRVEDTDIVVERILHERQNAIEQLGDLE